MIQARSGLGLALKPLSQLRRVLHLGVQNFDRYVTIVQGIVREIDGPKTSPAQFTLDLESPN